MKETSTGSLQPWASISVGGSSGAREPQRGSLTKQWRPFTHSRDGTSDLLGIWGCKKVKGHLWALSLSPVTSRVSVVLKKTHLTGEEAEAGGSDFV